jgi:hypothetical protein
MEILGYLGAIFLGVCAFPEMIRTIKDGRCHLGWPFLMMWYLGEVFMFIYIIPLRDMPLLFNYAFNILILSVMVVYKIKQYVNNTEHRQDY